MATAYAHAVRQRAVLLPWNYRFAGTQYEYCPALTVTWRLLKPVNQFPSEHSHRSYGPASCRCCFFCKTICETVGLQFSCSYCHEQFKTLSTADSQEYNHIYHATLELVHAQWLPPKTQLSLDWMNSFLASRQVLPKTPVTGTVATLPRLQKLKLSAQTHLIKPIES